MTLALVTIFFVVLGAVAFHPSRGASGTIARSVKTSGRVIALGLLCAGLTGCESFHGRLYWAGRAPGFLVASRCEAIQPGSGALVRVDTRDWQDGILPGVSVRFRGSRPGSDVKYQTDEHGLLNARVGPGPWRLDTRVSGFRPAHLELNLPDDQACTVKFQLRLSSHPELLVASGAVREREDRR